jgi:hypothetical protein
MVDGPFQDPLDERYHDRDEERREALRALLDATPMPAPEESDLRRELDEMRSRRPGSIKYP